MFEASQLLAFLAAILLVVAIGIWVKLFRGPELQRLNGKAAGSVQNVERASQLLVISVGVSAVASVFSFIDLF